MTDYAEALILRMKFATAYLAGVLTVLVPLFLYMSFK